VNEQYSRGVIVVALGCHVQCRQTVARLSRHWCTALQQEINDCIMTATCGTVQRRQTILSFIQFTSDFTDYRKITMQVKAQCKHQINQVKSLNGDSN